MYSRNHEGLWKVLDEVIKNTAKKIDNDNDEANKKLHPKGISKVGQQHVKHLLPPLKRYERLAFAILNFEICPTHI